MTKKVCVQPFCALAIKVPLQEFVPFLLRFLLFKRCFSSYQPLLHMNNLFVYNYAAVGVNIPSVLYSKLGIIDSSTLFSNILEIKLFLSASSLSVSRY